MYNCIPVYNSIVRSLFSFPSMILNASAGWDQFCKFHVSVDYLFLSPFLIVWSDCLFSFNKNRSQSRHYTQCFGGRCAEGSGNSEVHQSLHSDILSSLLYIFYRFHPKRWSKCRRASIASLYIVFSASCPRDILAYLDKLWIRLVHFSVA
jgi:hypothetical protein